MGTGDSDLLLHDGANIAVIGGGPAGSFFGIFCLQMAKMVGKEMNLTIFEPKDFTKSGPAGCNRCGGVISELLIQLLAVEGINLPETVVRKGIDSYRLHTNHGSVSIATPFLEKTIATVSRGGGPKGATGNDKESFDDFLLSRAVLEGAVRRPLMIDRVELRDGRPALFSRNEHVMTADLAVGAFGLNSASARIFEGLGFGYREPATVPAAIAEIGMGKDAVSEYFGNSIHLFLLPDRGIKFAAMIPKGSYVTLCILGDNAGADTVNDFLNKPAVLKALPESLQYSIDCRCLPKMNVGAPQRPFADRVVMCGDAGSSRLFKDGLGAAYIMGKAAAKTVVFHGVGKRHFKRHYMPVYGGIIKDNYFGKYLYMITDIYRKYGLLTKGMLDVVRREQENPGNHRTLSSVLWDMFTGNERYKAIFPRAMSLRMHINLWKEFGRQLVKL